MHPGNSGHEDRVRRHHSGSFQLMPKPRFIEIEGKRYLWRDIVQLRRSQVQAAALPDQPALFELETDYRPEQERTAAGRYNEPTLFTRLDRH
jgi:hypothetical protein